MQITAALILLWAVSLFLSLCVCVRCRGFVVQITITKCSDCLQTRTDLDKTFCTEGKGSSCTRERLCTKYSMNRRERKGNNRSSKSLRFRSYKESRNDFFFFFCKSRGFLFDLWSIFQCWQIDRVLEWIIRLILLIEITKRFFLFSFFLNRANHFY